VTHRREAAELHLHLEGALTARRALLLASAATDVPPPPEGAIVESSRGPRWSFDSLRGFLEAFGWASRQMRDAEAYVAVLDDLAASLRAQRVTAAEVFVALGQMHRGGVDPKTIVPALAARAAAIEAEGGPSIHFVADVTRNWGVAAADRALDDALDLQRHRIVGFGMGGIETSERARAFRGVFRRAADAGLGLCCHAGEGTTAESVRETVEELEVRRVGHGIAATSDPVLMRELRDEGIVLEVCPTSNERTGVWDPATPHPLLTLLEHGVPVVLGSDDPAWFDCTLRSEIRRVAEWGVPGHTIDAMIDRAHAVRFAR
jgi:adenosine deaminase